MVVLSISTYEPGLTTVSPSAAVIFAANPTPQPPPPPPPPPSSQPNVASPNAAMQPDTIIGIVIGLVLFAVLVLAFCFISRFPCFRQPKDVPKTLPRPRPWTDIDAPNHVSEDVPLSSLNAGRDLHNHNHHINGPPPRSRPPIHHVEPPVASYTCTFTEHWTLRYDHNPPYLPPYGGPSPPPYPEALQRPPQLLHSPPRAIVEA